MNTFSRIVLALTPAHRSEWMRALFAERPEITGRFNRLSWHAGTLWVLLWMHQDQIRMNPGMLLGGMYMKTVAVTLSVMGVIAGLFLIGLYVATTDPTLVPLLIGVGMLAQGLFTLIYLSNLLRSYKRQAKHILLAGQTVALTIGIVGGMIGFISNINPTNGDYEYGPMTMAALIALQAVVTLYLTIQPAAPHSTA